MADQESPPTAATAAPDGAVADQHALFGPKHPATAKCLHITASFLLKLGKTNEAHAQAQAAHEIFRQLPGAKHPQTLSTAKLLGSIKRPDFRIPSFKKGGAWKAAKPRKQPVGVLRLASYSRRSGGSGLRSNVSEGNSPKHSR
jgi:hypothetical protein